ncbi:GNAT family N-acetyltransferase [Glaciimonas sp. GG7]
MKFTITVGNWTTLGSDAGAVRHAVFVIEQNISQTLEWDGQDPVCIHAVAYDDAGQVLGTGRLLPDGHIGRMAVKLAGRGQGVGAAILQALMAQARQRGDAAVALNAQMQAEAFYQRFGFSRYGDVFMEAGIPHISMRYQF